jgi:triacylglycerol lipase
MAVWRALPAAPTIWCETELCQQASTGPVRPDCVVLIHGLGRTGFSMKRIEWELEKQGYRVISLSYPSTRISIEAAADQLEQAIREQALDQAPRLHFVTHSLGGIVLRQFLRNCHPSNLGRTVMLAPPNQGSELVDRLKGNVLCRMFTGPTGLQLGTEPSALPRRLGPVTFELGVIAGDRSLNPLFSAWIPGPDDGKVSIASTHIEGMRDFLLVHHTHTWMMWRQNVVRATLRFLESGWFGLDPDHSFDCGDRT